MRIPPSDATEVNQLIRALNLISVRVEQLVASEHEFVADLSHRLRTPLTALRLDSESIGDGPVAQRVRHAVTALETDVDDLIKGLHAIGATSHDIVSILQAIKSAGGLQADLEVI